MDAAAQNDMQALLDQYNKQKKIQDIPVYFGHGKDTIMGRYLLERFDAAAVVQDLEKLKQKPDEPVEDFYARVDQVFEKLSMTTPDTAKTGTVAELAAFSTDAGRAAVGAPL